MKVSAGEGVKSCGIYFTLVSPISRALVLSYQDWDLNKVVVVDPHLTLDLRIARFRFRRAVDFAIKQVGMFSLCYVFICFCNHSSRSQTERDQFVFSCFYRTEIILCTDGFEKLGAVDFAIKQEGKYFSKSQHKTHQIAQIHHFVTSKHFKWKT